MLERWVLAYHMFILISGLDSSLQQCRQSRNTLCLLSLQTAFVVAVPKDRISFSSETRCVPLFEPVSNFLALVRVSTRGLVESLGSGTGSHSETCCCR